MKKSPYDFSNYIYCLISLDTNVPEIFRICVIRLKVTPPPPTPPSCQISHTVAISLDNHNCIIINFRQNALLVKCHCKPSQVYAEDISKSKAGKLPISVCRMAKTITCQINELAIP